MTWKPRYLIDKAPWVDGSNIGEEEPCFVIRGQDILALSVILFYINEYKTFTDYDPNVLYDLECHYQKLLQWQDSHSSQIKIADR